MDGGFANRMFSQFPTGVQGLFLFKEFTVQDWSQLNKEVDVGTLLKTSAGQKLSLSRLISLLERGFR